MAGAEVTERTPYDEGVEAALVARLLVDPTQIPVVAADLHPEDLYVGTYRRAYQAMLTASQAGHTVDRATLGDVADAVDIRSLNGGFHAPLSEYIAIVKRDAQRRRIIDQLDRVVAVAYDTEDVQGILADLQDAVERITKGMEVGNLISMAQAIDLYAVTQKKRRAGELTGLRYGIVPLDKLLNPAQPGDMIVIAARPSVGKTTLAEYVAHSWGTHSAFPVLFCSLEMGLIPLLDRAVSRSSSVPASSITRGTLSEAEHILISEAIEEQRGTNLIFLEDPQATTASIRSAAAKIKLVHGGLAGIIVDYIGLLKDPGESENQRITKMSRNLKAVAREMDCPALVLSQLNRQVEGRDDPHPKLHDLRDSGALEQDADAVMGLTRKLGTNNLDVEVLKQRTGPVGMVSLYFDPTFIRISEDGDE